MLAANIVPLNQTFELASLPSATKTIYLDFTGHITTGAAAAAWGSTTDILTPPFTIDSDPAFNPSELATIQRTWARVAEDFAPFQVNVTTKEPSVTDLINAGGADTRWGIRVVIGAASGAGHPAASSGGIAIVSSFSAAADVPCFVNTLSSTSESFVSVAASHEVGHTLGLDHDGVSGLSEYFAGHGGTGQTSWGPLMGAPYDRNVTQWSKGEYASATTTEDDLAVIVGGNGFSYRPDDYRGTIAGAQRLVQPAGQTFLRGAGIIERNTDSDMFSFTVTTGVVDLRVRPLDVLDAATFAGANLDVGATLYAADGRLVADMQPQNRLDAQFNGPLTGGTYYVKVFGTGNASPLIDGYSNYGSLGQYTVTVSQSTPVGPLLTITSPTAVVEGNSGIKAVSFTVSLSKPATAAVTVNYTTRDGTATVSDGDYFAASGTLTFAPGETRKTINVSVVGDTVYEGTETFSVELSSPVNALLGRGEASATITNDDRYAPPPPAFIDVVGPSGSLTEGGIAVFVIQLSQALIDPVVVRFRTVGGTATAGQDFTAVTGPLTFAPGETLKTVSVSTIDDKRPEGDERFTLQLTQLPQRPGSAVVRTTSATATIAFNDGGRPSMLAAAAWRAFAAVAIEPPTRRK
jgi:hypothetical protein